MPSFKGQRWNDENILRKASPRWKRLELLCTDVTDAGLIAIARRSPNLEEIVIESDTLTSSAFICLASWPRLVSLLVTKMPLLDDQGLNAIGMRHNLRELYLEECKISNSGLDSIGGLPNLWSISLCKNQISDQGVEKLRPLEQLRLVRLDNTEVTGPGLSVLPRVDRMQLYLNYCPVSDSGIGEFLGTHPGIGMLSLNYTKITDDVMKNIASLALLEELRIEGTAVTDHGVLSLLRHPSLSMLYLSETGVSKDVIGNLKSESPKRLIVYT